MYRCGQHISFDETRSLEWDEIVLTDEEIKNVYECYLVYREDPMIQNNLGWLCQTYKKDFGESILWYELSAQQGYHIAQINLARIYENDSIAEIKQDYGKVFEYYNAASAKGSCIAQYNLGEMYYHGNGVTQDYNQSYIWYIQSAKQNYMYSQYKIGILYNAGLIAGVENNLAEAYKWFSLAANQGHTGSQTQLGHYYFKGKYVEKNYTFKLYQKPARKGDASAQQTLGFMYNKGLGVKEDFEEAARWYTLAANQGAHAAQNNLAYENLKFKIKHCLHNYVNLKHNEGISFLFFSNFLAFFE